MGARFRSWWQQIKTHPVATALIVLLAVVIVLIIVIILGYIFNWDWTGLSATDFTSTPQKTTRIIVYQPGKTLWDWLQLLAVLAIPVVVGIGAAWYTAQQGRVSDRENTDNQRETALQAYIDKISKMLLKENLRASNPDDEVRYVARSRTLTVLPFLDARRKSSLMQFLYESHLISIINLSFADLRGANLVLANLKGANLEDANLSDVDLNTANLDGANLHHANLRGAYLGAAQLSGAELGLANLSGANLSGAILQGANLSGTNLSGTNLDGAYLRGAYLRGTDLDGTYLGNADLQGADLQGADLQGADLQGADLTDAIVTNDQLAKTTLLQGATMPDGSIHD